MGLRLSRSPQGLGLDDPCKSNDPKDLRGLEQRKGNRKQMRRKASKQTITVNFMCEFPWATMPKCLAKHYSGCFCEGIFDEIYI